MKTVISIYLLLSFLSYSTAQDDWELKKDEDGVKVYTREIEGSKISEFKAKAVMEGKLSNFIAVMRDVENYDKLFTNQKGAKLLEITDTTHVHYVITDTPWPVTDRDGVYSYRYSQDYYDKSVKIEVVAVDGFVEKNDKYIRMRKAKGYWQFVPVDYNKVEVLFQMHAEPDGNIPGWIINLFIVDSPWTDLKNLRERVKLQQYANKKFDFLVE